jgi:signal transduction histidine kinase
MGQMVRAAYVRVRRTPTLRRSALVVVTLLSALVIDLTPGIRESNVAGWLVYVVAIAAYASAVEALVGLLVATVDGGFLLHQALDRSLLPDKTFIFVAALGAFDLAALLVISLIAHARRASEAARRAQRQAEEAAQLRAEFLGVASHDLRAPLTVMSATTELLQQRLRREGTLAADQLERHLERIHASATQMQHLLDEMADAAHLKSGEALSLSLEPVDLVEIVQRVASGAAAMPLGQDRTITLDCPAAVVVTADAARMQRVVQNLLDNALKYSAAPQPVMVTVEGRETAVALRVRDYGVGIPAAELPRVATYEFRATTARRFTGMGIGLAGAKKIVEMHGGSLAVESAEGMGTTVTVTLPVGRAAGAPAREDRVAEVGRSGLESTVTPPNNV